MEGDPGDPGDPGERLRELERRQRERLGATGEFPRGKIDEADEGELKLAVGTDRETGTVVMDFGK